MDETTLISLSMEELYRVFQAKKRDLKEEDYIKEKDIQKVTEGINIRFNLNKYFQYKDSHEWGVFRQKPKSDEIRADKHGYVHMDDFYNELQERNAIMLNALLDYYGEDEDTIESDNVMGLVPNDKRRKR